MGPPTKTELPQFTGLRGIAALLVLFFHVRTPQGLELNFGVFDAFSKFGFLGVDVFFVLSGFILTHVYGASFSADRSAVSLRRYVVARFARVYPLHLATLFLMLGAYGAAQLIGIAPHEASGYSAQSVVLSLLLVSEWFGVVAPNPSSWSISVEFACYLLFPLVAPLILATKRPLLLIFAGALLVEAVQGVGVVRGATEFLMGSLAYAAAKQYRVGPISVFAAPMFIAPFLASAAFDLELAGLSALCFACTVFMISSGSREPFSRICAARPLVFVGDISYSIYLLQWFIWIGWKHVLSKLPFFVAHPYLMVLCAALTVIVCAAASFHYFEKPMRSWVRRWRYAGQPAITS